MELVYRVRHMSFSDLSPFSHPITTVRVMPADAPISSAAFLEVTVKAPPALEASESPAQSAADVALQATQELLNEEAVRQHLASLLAAEAQG